MTEPLFRVSSRHPLVGDVRHLEDLTHAQHEQVVARLERTGFELLVTLMSEPAPTAWGNPPIPAPDTGAGRAIPPRRETQSMIDAGTLKFLIELHATFDLSEPRTAPGHRGLPITRYGVTIWSRGVGGTARAWFALVHPGQPGDAVAEQDWLVVDDNTGMNELDLIALGRHLHGL